MTRGTKEIIFRLIWFWNRIWFCLFDFLSSFLAEPAWLCTSDAREWHSYILSQKVATSNLHETTLLFHYEVLISVLLKNTGVYHARHLGKLLQSVHPRISSENESSHWNISHLEKMNHAGQFPILISLITVELQLVNASPHSLLLLLL